MKLGEWEGLLDKNTHKMSEDTFYRMGTRFLRSPGGQQGVGVSQPGSRRHRRRR